MRELSLSSPSEVSIFIWKVRIVPIRKIIYFLILIFLEMADCIYKFTVKQLAFLAYFIHRMSISLFHRMSKFHLVKKWWDFENHLFWV